MIVLLGLLFLTVGIATSTVFSESAVKYIGYFCSFVGGLIVGQAVVRMLGLG